MNPRAIDRFFGHFDRLLSRKADILLTGASAGSLMGHIRPSLDIDFEIRLRSKTRLPSSLQIAEAAKEAAGLSGVAVNFSENIGGWSEISYLDYRRTARSYKKIGRLTVRILAPDYWTIGKMTRFLELDIQDVVKIIRSKKIPAKKLIALWARALRASELSLALGRFRDHVLYFLKHYGRKAWGKTFDPQSAMTQFQKLIVRKGTAPC